MNEFKSNKFFKARGVQFAIGHRILRTGIDRADDPVGPAKTQIQLQSSGTHPNRPEAGFLDRHILRLQ